MDEQTIVTNRQDAEIFFTGHAIQGVLAGNSLMSELPNDLAKKAIRIGKAAALEMFPEPKEEEEKETTKEE